MTPSDSTYRQLNVTPLATVDMKRQRWAVRNQIPLGTVTILAGMAGIAKSTILAWYIAGITHGTLDGDLQGTPEAVAMINGEDDLRTVLKPRLVAAGVDVNLVSSISTVTVSGDEQDWITSPSLADDMQSIRDAMLETGAKLLIIDPIISLMSGDSHRLEDVRRNLDPLASMAADLDVAVVCVAHFNKGGGNAADKVSGSHAFRDIARSLLLLAVDDETDDRILTVEKSNYSPVKPSIAFQVDSVHVPTDDGDVATVGKATMLGDANVTVQDILKRDTSVLGDRSADLIGYVNEHPEGVRADDVADALDIEVQQARVYLARAATADRIVRVKRGVYGPRRNTEITRTDTVTNGKSVMNSEYITDKTHETVSAPVMSVFNSKPPACPVHRTPTHNGICGRCEAGVTS